MKKKSTFSGCSIAVTGKLENFTRNGINDLILHMGGIPRSSVSRKTDYLICGSGAGGKLSRGRACGTKIISEKEFLDMTAQERKAGREQNCSTQCGYCRRSRH